MSPTLAATATAPAANPALRRMRVVAGVTAPISHTNRGPDEELPFAAAAMRRLLARWRVHSGLALKGVA